MVEKCVAPSELHLKKELIILQKARTLRDPETCSSLRSPLSLKSLAAYNLCHENNRRNVSNSENVSRRLLEIPRRSEKSRKKVYLYNWKSYSSRSSEGGIKLDDDGKQPSIRSCHDDNVRNFHNEDILGDGYPLSAADIFNGRYEDLATETSRRSGVRVKKASISNKRVRKHVTVLKQPDPPSSPITVLSSVEQSDGTRQHNFEDAHYLGHDLLCKDSQHSPCTSSQFSGSGCANWARSYSIFRNTRRDGSPYSCTPASTCSYYRRVDRKPSTAGSWCGTTAFFEGDECDQLDLPVSQGCGLPCCWSKKHKERVCRGCYSPLCDTTTKVGDSIFCGSHKMYNASRSIGLGKPKPFSKSLQDSPLSTNSYVNTLCNKPLTYLEELDLEAVTQSDGRRWSISKSQDAFEVPGNQTIALEIADDKNLSFKYKPRIFDELVGQSIVVKSLMNAVLRNKVAPAYLFHGPHGTGKTSAARIFSAALNCLATEGHKPCCMCRACNDFYGERRSFVKEVNAANKNGIESIKNLLKNITSISKLVQYRILIINDCHLLTSKIWSVLLRFLEEPFPHVVFIFITIDHENLPSDILSHCQKYLFSKIKHADVVRRLGKLSAAENLDVEIDALNLIAANSDGSLQDAETVLYQLSLLGRRITTSLVNDLVGVVSDDKLLDLLELAMSSKAEETVKMSRELMDSGVDPMILVSQLAGVMMDIIAGTCKLAHSQSENVVLGGRNLTSEEVKRLQQALKILSDTEKQLKQSTKHSLLTTALLQLASGQNIESIHHNTVGDYANQIKDSVKKSSPGCNRVHNFFGSQGSTSLLTPSQRSKNFTPNTYHTSFKLPSCESDSSVVRGYIQSTKRSSPQNAQLHYSITGSPSKLSEIWRSCIEKCYSKTLGQFLSSHGKLISLTEDDGILIAFIAFADILLKSKAESYISSITNSLETVLKQNVEVRMGIVPSNWKNLDQPRASMTTQHMMKLDLLNNQRNNVPNGIKGLPVKNSDSFSFSRENRDSSLSVGHNEVEKYSSTQHQNGGLQLESCSASFEGNIGSSGTNEKGKETSLHNALLPFSNEQRLENAWLEDTEKSVSGLPNLSRNDTNLIIHQNSGSSQLYCDPLMANDRPSIHQEDDHDIKALETNDILYQNKEQFGEDKNHYTISPNKVHGISSGTNFDQQNLEYESGPGCNGLFCWKTNKSHRRQMKQGSSPKSQKSVQMLSFRKKVKSKMAGNRLRR